MTYFTKKDTTIIKGIAIVLMLMHHLWRFPDRLYISGIKNVFTIFGQSATIYLGDFGKICVTLFFFVSGYGLYKSHQNKPFDIVSKVKNLFLSYWKVFFIFVPIAFLFFSHQPDYAEKISICHRYETFSWQTFLMNMLGVNTQYNGEWWFLFSYICAIISFPVIRKIVHRHSASINLCLVTVATILLVYATPFLEQNLHLDGMHNNSIYTELYMGIPYISGFWMGIVMAKDNLLLTLRDQLTQNHILNPVSDFALIAGIIFLRETAIGEILDFVYVPFLIVISLHFLEYTYVHWLRAVFEYLGRHSTNMWLCHTFFCYYFYPTAKFVLLPRYAVPCLLILIVVSLFASILLDWFWNLFSGKLRF